MKVLVTRPLDQSKNFATLLSEKGLQSVICPLIEITNIKKINTLEVVEKSILLTSQNGLCALEDIDRSTKIFLIGKETYKQAKEKGFTNCYYLGKDIKDLKINLPRDEKILYLSANEVTDNLNEFSNVTRDIVYRSELVYQTKEIFFKFFNEKETKIITLFSLRTAKNLIYLINKYNMYLQCEHIIVVSLSAGINEVLRNIPFRKTEYVEEPETILMVKLLEKIKNAGRTTKTK